jgi:hypothetical protein
VGVVATTLVREARSKSVEGLAAPCPLLAKEARSGAPTFGVVDWTSTRPSSRKEREKDGAPVSGVTQPRAFRATRLPWWVTASETAGKA